MKIRLLTRQSCPVLLNILLAIAWFVLNGLPLAAHATELINPSDINKPTKHSASANQQKLRVLRNLPESVKLTRINHFFNKFNNQTDKLNWGIDEYWATPRELFKKGAGDCEDLAVAKYFFLIKLGVSEKQLRLAYVKVYNSGKNTIEDHLVLLYDDNDKKQTLVLDNIADTIKPLAQRRDLVPQFAFNIQGSWALNPSYTTGSIAQSSVYRSWQTLLPRLILN